MKGRKEERGKEERKKTKWRKEEREKELLDFPICRT